MEDDSIADSRFQEILAIDGISLADAKAQYPYSQLFKEGAEFPEFFNDQQEGTNRIIKQLVPDSHSNLRVIYLEILRLALDDDDDTFLVNLKRKVFSAGFDIAFTIETESNREIFNDFQFKRFFAEFVNLAFQYRNLGIQTILQNFPLIDQVFIHIFRSILTLNGIKEDFNTILDTQIVFSILGKEFGLDILSYPGCWKFEDADMVCYEGPQKQLYLVYTIEQITKDPILVSSQVPQGNESSKIGGHHQNTQSNSEPYKQGQTSQNVGSATEQQIITQTSTNNVSNTNLNNDTPTFGNNGNPTTQSISYDFKNHSPIQYGFNDFSYSQPSNYDTFTSNIPSYGTNYQTHYSHSYMPTIDDYKIDDKTNDLVNKYLNMNPEDIISTKYSSVNNTVSSSVAIGATGNYVSSYQYPSSNYTSPLTHYQQPAIDYNYTKDYSSSLNTNSSLSIDNALTSKYSQYNMTNLVGNINLESNSTFNAGSSYKPYDSTYKSTQPYLNPNYSQTNDLVEKYTNPSYNDSFNYKH